MGNEMVKNDRMTIAIVLSIIGIILMVMGTLRSLSPENTATIEMILFGGFLFLGGMILSLKD